MMAAEGITATISVMPVIRFLFSVIMSLFVSGILIVYIYVRCRSGSSFVFHEKIWSKLVGKNEFDNDDINDAWRKVIEHERFSFKTGVRFRSHANILATLQWLSEKKIELEELIKVRSFFSPQEMKMRKPQMGPRRVVGLFLIILFIISAAGFYILSIPAALLKVKETSTSIWVTEESARSFFGHEMASKSACLGFLPEEMAEHDIKVICSLLTNEESKDYIDRTINSQRIFGSSIFLLFTLILFLSARDYALAKQALIVYRRSIKEPAPGIEP